MVNTISVYTVSKNGSHFELSRNVGGIQVTVNMPEQHSQEQEKQVKQQIIKLIAGKINGGNESA